MRDPFEELFRIDQSFSKTGNPEKDSNTTLGLAFVSHDQLFVTPLNGCVEISYVPFVTNVPGTLPWYVGVLPWRTGIIQVIDFAEFFEQKKDVCRADQQMIIVQGNDETFGVMVGAVEGLKRMPTVLPKTEKEDVLTQKNNLIKHQVYIEDQQYIYIDLFDLTQFSIYQDEFIAGKIYEQ